MPHIPVQKGKGQRTNVTVFRLHGYHDTVLCRQGKKKKQAPCPPRLAHTERRCPAHPCLSCGGCLCDPPHNDLERVFNCYFLVRDPSR
jgi:hypothetical protein